MSLNYLFRHNIFCVNPPLATYTGANPQPTASLPWHSDPLLMHEPVFTSSCHKSKVIYRRRRCRRRRRTHLPKSCQSASSVCTSGRQPARSIITNHRSLQHHFEAVSQSLRPWSREAVSQSMRPWSREPCTFFVYKVMQSSDRSYNNTVAK